MTRVIHTGDTHLGYRQYHSPERRRDFLRAFRQVIDDAIEDDVDAVVHAGDLYHDRNPGLRDLQGTIDVLRKLRDADVPFLGVVGNHDGKRDGQWLDLFESLGLATRLDDEGTVVGDATFYGLDYVPESRRDGLEYDFDPPTTDNAALVSHGLFTPFEYGTWDTEGLLDASNVSFDALLLGDNHTPDRAEIDDTWVTYCGSTERTSASEREERGYNIVEFDSDEVRIRRRGLDATREFAFVDVELGEGEGSERVREQIRQYELEDAVAIVTIEGDGEPVTPASIEEFAAERGALIARVNDRREIDTEAEVSISFADPDEAVRERVRDLGLSEAALGIDETVRTSDVADANVRDRVENDVRELLEDPETFEGMTATVESSGDGVEDETREDTESANVEADEPAVDEPAGNEPGDSGRSEADETAADDGQVSMEDYL